MDGTGWCGTTADGPDTVCRGSAASPTMVILTGTVLAHGNGRARDGQTAASVDAIVETINNPKIGGQLDQACVAEY